MEYSKTKRKTRPQKRFFKVGIGASVFAVLFIVGTTISALNISHKTELDNLFGTDYIENLIEGEKDSYYVTTSVKNEGAYIGGNIYHYNNEDKIVEKVDVYKQAKDKFGIDTELTRFSVFYPSYDTDKAYIGSGKYLLAFSGLNENSLTLTGYTNNFTGEIKYIASSDTDLYVVSKEGSRGRITRFAVGDNNFDVKAMGYMYDNDLDDEKHQYLLSPYNFDAINSLYADGNNLYLFTKNNLFLYSKDLKGTNYKVLFAEEFAAQKLLHPELTDAQNKEAAKSTCLSKYGWINYDYSKDEVTLNEKTFDSSKFSYFTCEDKLGSAIYEDKIVLLGRNKIIYTADLNDLLDLEAINDLDDECVIHRDIVAPYQLAGYDNALCYYGFGSKAIVRYYDTTDCVSIFNLRDLKYEKTVGIANSISEAFLNESNNEFYYKYTDKVNKSADRNYISRTNIILEENSKIATACLIAFAVLLGVAVICMIVCFSSFGSKKTADKVMSTGRGMKKHWPIYVIIIPSFALLCLFCYYPGISAIATSFFDYKPGVSDLKVWNNFANYAQIFGSAQSLRHFGNMIIFLAADLVIATIPPLIFAFFLSVLRFKKFSGVLRTLLFIPGIIPGVAGVLIWKNCIYGPYGLLNTIITAAGGTKIDNFFDSQNYLSIISLLMMGFPFVGSYLIFYGSMMNIPKSYYEAAELDGITVWKRFIKIDLPLCLPQLKYVIIMTIIASIQNFSRIWIGMAGDPGLINTPITKMYDLMYNEKNYGLASAYATVLFVILFGLTFVSMRKKASNQIK